MVRLATSLLALVMFATSGMIGGVVYLCLMDGQVRSQCCCKKAQATGEGGGLASFSVSGLRGA